MTRFGTVGRCAALLGTVAFLSGAALSSAKAQELPPAFVQVVAAAASGDDGAARFYQAADYRPLWTGADSAGRRQALLSALALAPAHGLPATRYDAEGLARMLAEARTEGDRARAEVAFTLAYLRFAHDISSGVLDPQKIDAGIAREIDRPDPLALLQAIASQDPVQVLRDLAPKSPEYAQLMRAKLGLEDRIAKGGWGPAVPAKALVPGDQGPAVVALRDRLVAMGYLTKSATRTYDKAIQAAVQRFQLDNGLIADGFAYEGTLNEINVAPEQRLKSVIVAMERMRWMRNLVLGERHVWVNLPDFSARIVDHGKTTFETRAVIGKNVPDQHTPEFSDMMEHMVVNPSWGVPRSITVKEYLPLLQRNPNAVSHLQVVDRRGRVVPRGAVNFAAYSGRTFPFALRQPPSDGNALGKVKFMFPNKYNIYLHDTPAKNLFSHEVRAYSHGCIRLAEPFDFAYALLARQSDDPKGIFAGYLNSGRESTVKLDANVPVHLVYFTAFPGAKGQMTYRRDVYGRDGMIAGALEAAGVVMGQVQG